MTKAKSVSIVKFVALCSVAAASAGIANAQGAGDVVLGERVHPESIAATPDGGLIIGSIAQNVVYRAAPGATTAEPWLTTGFVEGGTVLGVFAIADTAYVCANGAFGSGVGNLLAFDLATAELKGTYPLPGGGLCNDIAAAPDGTIYVTDTSAVGRILKLAPSAEGVVELSVVVAGTFMSGIDGIAFIGDVLYGNNVMNGELYRFDLDAGGIVAVTTLETSRPLAGPDGMRTTLDGERMLLAENGTGVLSMLTIDGDRVTVETLAEGFEQSVGVAQVGNTAYVVEAKFAALMDPNAPNPGVFVARAVALP